MMELDLLIGVILWFLGVVNYCSVRGCVICGFFGVVLECLGVVARFSVGCGVANWSISVVFLVNLVRRSSFCVVISRDCVILGRLSCGCVDRGRVVLWGIGVVFDSFGGVIS